MQVLDGSPLHRSQFAGIHLVCPSELEEFLKNYFHDHGFDVDRPICFSSNAPYTLNLTFKLATQAAKLAGTIMGLLNRNDIEIEMHLCTGDNQPKATKVKLRDIKDVDACERLIDKLAAIAVTPRQDSDK